MYYSLYIIIVVAFSRRALHKIKKVQCLERKPHQPYLVFKLVHNPGQTGIWSVVFCGGRKSGEPGEKLSEQGENQQQTQPTYDTRPELNLFLIGGRQALSPLNHSCSPINTLTCDTWKAGQVWWNINIFISVKQCDNTKEIQGWSQWAPRCITASKKRLRPAKNGVWTKPQSKWTNRFDNVPVDRFHFNRDRIPNKLTEMAWSKSCTTVGTITCDMHSVYLLPIRTSWWIKKLWRLRISSSAQFVPNISLMCVGELLQVGPCVTCWSDSFFAVQYMYQ